MKRLLVPGVHYTPTWVDPERVRLGSNWTASGRFQSNAQSIEAIRAALRTKLSCATTIALLIEADGQVVARDQIGKTTNQVDSVISDARDVLGRDAILNHRGSGYSMPRAHRAAILKRARLADE